MCHSTGIPITPLNVSEVFWAEKSALDVHRIGLNRVVTASDDTKDRRGYSCFAVIRANVAWLPSTSLVGVSSKSFVLLRQFFYFVFFCTSSSNSLVFVSCRKFFVLLTSISLVFVSDKIFVLLIPTSLVFVSSKISVLMSFHHKQNDFVISHRGNQLMDLVRLNCGVILVLLLFQPTWVDYFQLHQFSWVVKSLFGYLQLC